MKKNPFFTQEEWAIVRKDCREVWSARMVRLTLVLVPLLLSVFLPALYLALALLLPEEETGMEELAGLLPPGMASLTGGQAMFYLIGQVVSPMFFLMIPLMASSVSAACSFVGERERGTIETLLLTPVPVRRIFRAKTAACVLISLLTGAVSFAAFAIVMAVGSALLRTPYFFNGNWAVLVFLLAPAVNLFGVTFMVLVSGRSKSSMEAMQTSGYLVLPLLLLFIGQLSGLFSLNVAAFLILSLLLWAADAALLAAASRWFTPERLLRP